MKVKNKLFLSFLQYDWWKIAGVSLIVAAVLGFGYNYKDKAKDDETLEIFVSASTKDLSFQDDLHKKVEGDGILTVNCFSLLPSDLQFNVLASTYLSGISDLFLLGESVLSSHTEYLAYTQEGTGEAFDSIKELPISLYDGDSGGKRGIKVYDKDNVSYNEGKKFSSWFSFEETTYLFVSSESSNADSKTKEGKSLLWEAAYYFLTLGLE